jgi:hypothetical protein
MALLKFRKIWSKIRKKGFFIAQKSLLQAIIDQFRIICAELKNQLYLIKTKP